jgi:hypothetical protein
LVHPIAFTVLANTAIVLTSTTVTCFPDSNLEGVGALLQTLLNGYLSVPIDILFRVQAAHTGANLVVTRLSSLEA